MRKWVTVAAVAAVTVVTWRGYVAAREWQSCGASGSQSASYVITHGAPSLLECFGVALTTPAPVPTPAAVPDPDPAPDVPCGDPGLGAYAFTRDSNGCEIEEAGLVDQGDLPAPLPAPYDPDGQVGCSAAAVDCSIVYVPDVPDDGGCVELAWDGDTWVRGDDPAAYLCPKGHGG